MKNTTLYTEVTNILDIYSLDFSVVNDALVCYKGSSILVLDFTGLEGYSYQVTLIGSERVSLGKYSTSSQLVGLLNEIA